MSSFLAAHPAPVHPRVLPTIALALAPYAVLAGLIWLARRIRRPRPSIPARQSRPPAEVHEITDARPFDRSYAIGPSTDDEGGENE